VLGRRLLELKRQDPLQPIYVIAHSHGGSVFAYALKEEESLADHVDGFIALSTPWIGVRICGYAVALRSLLLNTIFYLLLLPSLLGAGRASQWLLEYLIAQRPITEDRWLALGEGLGDIATLVLWYMLTGVAVGVVWYLLNGRLRRWLASSAAEFELQIEVAADAASTLLHDRLPPSVFFKPIGDEAALALAWTSGMASLMQAASQLLFRVLQSVRDSWLSIPRYGRIIGSVALILIWCVGTAVLAVFTLLAGESTTAAGLATTIRDVFHLGFRPQIGDFDMGQLLLFDLPGVFALVVWGGVIVALLALISVTLAAWLAAAGAGIPALRTALFMRIIVEAAPLGNHQLVLVDVLAPQREGRVAATALSHSSLYESPSVIAAVLGAVHGFPERTARQTGVVPGSGSGPSVIL
jgi:hypothetical protein